MGKTYQTAEIKARCANMVRNGGIGRFYMTGVSKNDLRAADADDEIAEALAELAEKRRKAKEGDK